MPLPASLSGSITPATMLDASMLVDVNCVQFAALDAEVLIALVRSIILFLLTLPLRVALVRLVTVNWLALRTDTV